VKLEVQAQVFEVNPLADPARGGRWCSLQFWRDVGTARVTQLCDYKWRLRTPAPLDPTDEIRETTQTVARILEVDGVDGVARVDSVEVQ
jgi:hypothetical protein